MGMKSKPLIAAILSIVCLPLIAITVSYVTRAAAETGGSASQDPQSLDRRISMLEQRLFFIESRIGRLEQQATVTVRQPSSDQSKVEIELLRNQVETMKGQINELGCGLAKLDERTLSASAREARARNAYRDPCRINPETPLRLTTHP
jgi:uncharacterized coiled-coil protein SlyX